MCTFFDHTQLVPSARVSSNGWQLYSFIVFLLFFVFSFLEFTFCGTELFLSVEMTDNEVLFCCTQVECR